MQESGRCHPRSAERGRVMCNGWMNPLIPESTRIKIADGEITRLRAELAKVTWQRNEAHAALATSQAECDRLRADTKRIDHIERRRLSSIEKGYVWDLLEYDCSVQSKTVREQLDAALAREVKP